MTKEELELEIFTLQKKLNPSLRKLETLKTELARCHPQKEQSENRQLINQLQNLGFKVVESLSPEDSYTELKKILNNDFELFLTLDTTDEVEVTLMELSNSYYHIENESVEKDSLLSYISNLELPVKYSVTLLPFTKDFDQFYSYPKEIRTTFSDLYDYYFLHSIERHINNLDSYVFKEIEQENK